MSRRVRVIALCPLLLVLGCDQPEEPLAGATLAADAAGPACTCGSDAVEPDSRPWAFGNKPVKQPQPSWCSAEGPNVLRAVYDPDAKVPQGFRGKALTDEQIVYVVWVTRPTAPRIIGSYRVASTLVHSANLDDARRETKAFFERAQSMDQVVPLLAEYSIINEQKREQFFELLAPSTFKGKSVAFRVWRTEFLKPTVDGVLADADRLSIGTVSPDVDAAAISLFMQSIWWENYRNLVGAKVLSLPEGAELDGELRVTMPVTYLVGGDWPDKVERQIWKVRVSRRTGEITREITTDIVCVGKNNAGGFVKP